MRLMILRAALFAADADLAAGAPEVQTPAPQPHGLGSEDGNPTHAVSERGLEQLADPESTAAVTVQDDGTVTQDAPGSSSPRELKPDLCMPVIVRQKGVLAAGIVVEEDKGRGIAVQIFRGDHGVHAAHHVSRADPAGTDDGWFFPWERDPIYAKQSASAAEEPAQS